MMAKQDIYAAITQRIVEAIEAGTAPWRKPWRSSGGFPISLRSGKPYRGVNVLLLSMAGYDDPRWGTYKAISEAGGQVRKGEKATQIVLHKPVPKKDPEEGESQNYWLLRFFSVFNAKQADGLPELPKEEERQHSPIAAAEAIVNGYAWTMDFPDNKGPRVSYGFDRAAYSPLMDEVYLPSPEQFISDESYYATYFHELAHSTGHEKRSGRIEPALFGTDPYAKEELVAEFGASFLCGMAGFEEAIVDQSAAYLSGWLEKLKGDPKFVVQAAAQAQKAADLILGTKFDSDDADSRIRESEPELVTV